MHVLHFCIWLQHTAVGTAIRTSAWLFPLIESFHIVGLAFLIGAVIRLDVRLLGFHAKTSVTEVSRAVLPWTWGGFALAVVTGSLMFSSEAEGLYSNKAFRLKLVMLVLLGINTAVFELLTRRNIHRWDVDHATPVAAKFTAAVSIVLWICVVIAGRWIAYA